MSASQITAVTSEMIQAYKENFAKTESLERYLSSAKRDFSNLKNLKRTVDVVEPELKKLKTTNKIVDALKRGAFKEINPSWGTRFAAFIGVLNAGFTTFLIKKNEEIQELNIQSQKATEAGVADAFTRTINNSILIKGLNTRVKDVELSDQRTRDRVYGLEQQNITINDGIEIAAQKANDALYEVRQGRTILEKKINDNLYESRRGKIKTDATVETYRSDFIKLKNDFSKYVGKTGDNLQTTFQDTLKSLQKSLTLANQEIKKANDTISLQQKTLDTTAKIAKALPSSLNVGFKAIQDTTKKILETNIIPVQQATKKWGVSIGTSTITPATVTISESGGVTVTPSTGGVIPVTYADFSTSEIGKQLTKQDEIQDKQIATLGSGLSAVGAAATAAQNTANAALNKGTPIPDLSGVKADIGKVQADLNRTKADLGSAQTELNKTKADLTKIDTKLKEQEKMNQQGNQKLDQLFPLVSGLPLIVGRAEQNIINKLPTPAQMSDAAATGVCRTAQPGGCMNKALTDSANDIKTNANNNAGAVLDAINTGANAALLAGQQTILARLGAQIPGGIGGKLGAMANWLQLGRILDVLTFAATVHNATQLSNDIAMTLGQALGNVLSLIGIKDDAGNPLDISSILNSTVQNIVKGIVGDEQYTQLSTAWAKANRIYQASTNILNSFQSLSSAILTGLEMTAGKVAKIGNALRKSGEVLESAYGWMNPQPKFNRVTQTLENLQQGASTIQMVTQAPLDIINATTELTTATTELTNAIKQDENPANKGKEAPEPDKLKADESTAKLASASLELIDLDLDPDD